MALLRIYTDTSVFGGCEDIEFRSASLRLVESFIRGDSTLVLSELTLEELKPAPDNVKRLLARIPNAHIDTVRTGRDAESLAEAYVAQGVVSPKMRADALHIALATISGVDALVSWNFKHIVNLKRIRAYNEVNALRGYPEIEIRTPSEVIDL
jgi:predicted nucleic acid-binding protein